jgi:hypothetical protein
MLFRFPCQKIAHHSNLAVIKNQGLQRDLRPSKQWLWQSHAFAEGLKF